MKLHTKEVWRDIGILAVVAAAGALLLRVGAEVYARSGTAAQEYASFLLFTFVLVWFTGMLLHILLRFRAAGIILAALCALPLFVNYALDIHSRIAAHDTEPVTVMDVGFYGLPVFILLGALFAVWLYGRTKRRAPVFAAAIVIMNLGWFLESCPYLRAGLTVLLSVAAFGAASYFLERGLQRWIPHPKAAPAPSALQ